MIILLTLLIVLIAFEFAAWKWGFNSRDDINSPEWERLRNWIGFH